MNKQMDGIISTGFDQGFETQLQVFAPGCHNLEWLMTVSAIFLPNTFMDTVVSVNHCMIGYFDMLDLHGTQWYDW